MKNVRIFEGVISLLLFFDTIAIINLHSLASPTSDNGGVGNFFFAAFVLILTLILGIVIISRFAIFSIRKVRRKSPNIHWLSVINLAWLLLLIWALTD